MSRGGADATTSVSMTPADLTDYFTTCAAIAGSLIGLLFVAIALRYEVILGPSAPPTNAAVARSAFVALIDAMSISLWALLPGKNLGYAGAIVGALCLWSTVRTHMTITGRRATSTRLFVVSLALYAIQVVASILLIAYPRSSEAANVLAYVVFGAFIAALRRSWQLIQHEGDPPETGRVPEER